LVQEYRKRLSKTYVPWRPIQIWEHPHTGHTLFDIAERMFPAEFQDGAPAQIWIYFDDSTAPYSVFSHKRDSDLKTLMSRLQISERCKIDIPFRKVGLLQ
jgi:hypothetical protein